MSICIITGKKAQRGSPFSPLLRANAASALHLISLGAQLGQEEPSQVDGFLDELHAAVNGLYGPETFALMADPEAAQAKQDALLAQLEAVEEAAADEAEALALPAPPEVAALPEPAPDGIWRDEDGQFTAADDDADGEAESFDSDDDDDEAESLDEPEGALAVACPHCDAEVGAFCVTGSGNATDPHRARRDAAGE